MIQSGTGITTGLTPKVSGSLERVLRVTVIVWVISKLVILAPVLQLHPGPVPVTEITQLILLYTCSVLSVRIYSDQLDLKL